MIEIGTVEWWRVQYAALERERDAAIAARETYAAESGRFQALHVEAIADNAALLDGLRHARAILAALRDTDNPKSRRASAERAVASADAVLLAPHSGAALLEELDAARPVMAEIQGYQHVSEPTLLDTLRRLLVERLRITKMVDPDLHATALVRARNEGLEKVAEACLAKRDGMMRDVKPGTRRGGLEEAASIARAMKEPES